MNDLTARIDEVLKGSEGHTPGPWGYKAGFAKHYAFSLDEGEDFGISLQDMHWQDGRDVPAEQNARLIASAPSLRALLVEARAQLAAQAEALAAVREAMSKGYTGWDIEYADQQEFEESVWQSDRAHEAALPTICEIRTALLGAQS